MPETREENSVLFSLKELQRLEDERVRKEDDEKKARVDAERRAREDAERQAREAVDRKRREEEDRVRRIEEERLNREREEQLRLVEAERRARVDGEMRLAEERMRLEVQAKKQAKSPIGPIIGVAVVLLVVGGGVIWKLKSDADADRVRVTLEAQRAADEAKRREEELQRKFTAQMGQLQGQLAQAKDEETKARIRAQIEETARANDSRRKVAPSRKEAPVKADKPASPVIKQQKPVDDDPLGGLKL
jgi:hypothetical protein